MDTAIKMLAASGLGQDRATAIPAPGGWLVALADGAGGMGGGAAAAERLIDVFSKLAPVAPSTDWAAALARFDQELSAHPSGGQTTGVVAFIDSDRVVGASVGDSSAWLLSGGVVIDLTTQQRRKPLLGSGDAVAVRFEAAHRGSRLLFASDGLTKYTTADRIRTLAAGESIEAAADALANSVRLPSDALQDDVGVVLVGGKGPTPVG